MELQDLVRGRGRFVALCALVPILAAAVAFAAVRDERVRHRTEVTVAVPATVATGNASLVAQWVAGFRDAVTDPEVLAAAADATGLRPGAVADALRIRQDGRGPFVEVVVVSTDPAVGDPVLDEVIPAAVARMAEPQRQEFDARQRDLEARSIAFLDARVALDEFVDRTGELEPAESLRAREATLTTQRFQFSVEEDVDSERADGIARAIVALEAEVAALRPLVVEHDGLARTLDDTQRALDVAEDDLAGADGALEAALAPAPLAAPDTTEVPPGPTVRRAVVLAFGLGLAVAIGLIVLRGFLGAPAPFSARREEPAVWPDDRRLPWWRELALPVTATAAESTSSTEPDPPPRARPVDRRDDLAETEEPVDRWGAPVWVVGDGGTEEGWQPPARSRPVPAGADGDPAGAGDATVTGPPGVPVVAWISRRSRAMEARNRARSRSRAR